MSGSPPHVLALVGPTASGKSAVGLVLAQLLNGEILSADSRQIYRFMDIGTAKPGPEERRRVPHHFIDERDPDEEFSAGQFGLEARERITQILSRGRTPIVVGGSGLYVRALLDGLFDGPGADPQYRALLEKTLADGRLQDVLEELQQVDPETAKTVDRTKPRRIIRALEVFHQTGIPLSEHLRRQKPITVLRSIQVAFLWERDILYDRINSRCAQMKQAGLLEEAAGLARRGYTPVLNALNTVGYAEAFACLRGELSEATFLSTFRQNSRRYAKRQLTWFHRDPRILWLPAGGHSEEALADRVAAAFRSFVNTSP